MTRLFAPTDDVADDAGACFPKLRGNRPSLSAASWRLKLRSPVDF
jgi:hypothetical protein